MAGQQNPALQKAFISETVADGSYYTVLVKFADYDTGSITGVWGKNSGPSTALGSSGYHRLDEYQQSSIGFDFGNERCILLASDYEYKRLEGELYNKQTKVTVPIVFNRA